MRAEATSPLRDDPAFDRLLNVIAEHLVETYLDELTAADGNLHCTEAHSEGVPA